MARRACLLLLLGLLVQVPAKAESLEHAVKATYLYKLIPFVTWVDGGHPGAYSLCIVGNPAMARIAEQAVKGQWVEGRSIEVRQPAATDPLESCHVLYLAGLPEAQLRSMMDGLVGAAVLTVTDGVPDARVHGVVHFVLRDNRVRFQIDVQAARRNGLSLSSKLLDLALTVTPRGQEAVP